MPKRVCTAMLRLSPQSEEASEATQVRAAVGSAAGRRSIRADGNYSMMFPVGEKEPERIVTVYCVMITPGGFQVPSPGGKRDGGGTLRGQYKRITR